VILLALDRKFNFRRGRLFWLYAMYYTLGRVWIEAMRIDDAEQINLFGITTRLNVWTSIFVFLAALIVFIVLGLRKRDEPDTPYLAGHGPAADAGAKQPEDAELAAVPADGKSIRHSDKSVSDSGSRGNLPDNQNGPGHTSAPTEAVKEPAVGTTPAKGGQAAENSIHLDSGSAPDTDRTK
jgi:hypothetical protein